MAKPKTCIRCAGTRTGRIRARVERTGEPHFEVSLGTKKWFNLDLELQAQILERAKDYLIGLNYQLIVAEGLHDADAKPKPDPTPRHRCDVCVQLGKHTPADYEGWSRKVDPFTRKPSGMMLRVQVCEEHKHALIGFQEASQ